MKYGDFSFSGMLYLFKRVYHVLFSLSTFETVRIFMFQNFDNL